MKLLIYIRIQSKKNCVVCELYIFQLTKLQPCRQHLEHKTKIKIKPNLTHPLALPRL